jgi:hypothetical protein
MRTGTARGIVLQFCLVLSIALALASATVAIWTHNQCERWYRSDGNVARFIALYRGRCIIWRSVLTGRPTLRVRGHGHITTTPLAPLDDVSVASAWFVPPIISGDPTGFSRRPLGRLGRGRARGRWCILTR